MAQINTYAGFSPLNIFSRAASHIGQFFVDMAEAQSRSHQIKALTNLTDEELAEIGLKRHEIAQHVFRDKLFM